MRYPWKLTLAALAASTLGQPAVGQCLYEATVIGPPPCGLGPPPVEAFGVNEQGHVVGMRGQCGIDFGDPYPFLWTPQTGLVNLSMPPNTNEGQAFDLNDAGQIVGEVSLTGDAFGVLAFVLDGRGLTIIPPLAGGVVSQAFGNNSIGQVVGITDSRPAFKGFVWHEGVLTLLEGPFGPGTVANDINDKGQIVGWMGSGQTSDSHAFLYTEGKFLDLGVIPGGTTAQAFALNELGDVVGVGCLPRKGKDNCVSHAFLWSGGKMTDLGTLPGFSASSARDINNFGQIVGFCTRDNIPWKAFIWQNGVMTDLNDLIVAGPPVGVGTAHAINDAGQIVGRGGIDGHGTGYLLTPLNVPIGDVDRNCHVDAWDLFLLLRQWGACPYCPADVDDDDVVGIVDLLVLLANWG